MFYSATDRIDVKYLNRWVKDRICEHGLDYLEELAAVLLPHGKGKTQIKIVKENHRGDIQSCFTTLFDVWSDRVEATWQKLIDALRYTDKVTLASDIEEALIVSELHQQGN